MRHPLAHAWALLAVLLMTPTASHAYSLQTAVSRSCHEQITARSLGVLLELVDVDARVEVPDDPVLDRLLDTLQFPGTADADDATRFLMLSIIVGVRSPDTDGHSTFDLAALRRLHADPDPRGQYAHALRGPDDDGIEGDIAAVDGTLAAIIEEVMLGAELSAGGAIVRKPAYLDHYGRIEVPVVLFAWHVGRAIHALQDAHAHMIWDADIRHVVGVLNYVDAVEGHLDSHDGLAHSNALDDCDRDDVAPMVEAATRRTSAMVRAIVTAVETRDETPLRRGLAACPDAATDPDTCGWLVYNPACRAAVAADDTAAIDAACCTDANDFCGSPYAEIAREDSVGPYLGCATASPGLPGGLGWLTVAVLALIAARRRAALALAVISLVAHTPEAAADPPRLSVALEGHATALDDRVDSAILAPAFSYGVRVGWRVDRWRFGLHVDRDYWVSVEYGTQVDAGVLEVAAFAEALFFDDYVRVGLAIGSSTLMFDTLLHDSGRTGLFVEARPIGLRFPVYDHLWIVLDPLTGAVTMPAIEPDDRLPTLRKVQRRTVLAVEGSFL